MNLARWRSEFVGRQPELQRLRELCVGATRRGGALALVVGEAGFGKTRLVDQFLGSLDSKRRIAILRGECLENTTRPFGPIRAMLHDLREMLPSLEEGVTPLGRLALANLEPMAPRDVRLDRADVHRGLFDVVAQASQQRTLLLVIEDLHWADTATLEALAFLAPRIGDQRLFVIATLREEAHVEHATASAIARIERIPGVARIALRPLNNSELRALVKSAAGPRSIAPKGIASIVAASEGNPLFAEELLERDLTSDRPSHNVPRTIASLFSERLTRLESEDRRVLVHAAVLGERFDPQMLAAVLERPIASIEPALRHARDLAFVIEDGPPPNTFRFRHALSRQALYDSQLALTLRPLHERIARKFEGLPNAASRVEELAFHWWHAGIAEPARRYNEAAGDAALALCAYADAAVQYERALSLTEDALDRARLMELLGTAHRSAGDADAGITWCMAASDAYAEAGRFSAAVPALAFGCSELSNAGRADEASEYIRRFLSAYAPKLERSAEERIRCSLLLLEGVRLDRDPAQVFRENPIDPAHLQPEAATRYWAARMVKSAYYGDEPEWCIAALGARAALAAGDVRPLDRSSTLNFQGLTALQLGRLDDARAAFAISREECVRHDLRGGLAYLDALCANEAYLRGALTEARDFALRATENARFATARTLAGLVGPFIGIALGDAALIDATICLDVAGPVAARGLRLLGDLACGGVAAAWISRGNVSEARSLLESAIEGVSVPRYVLMPLAAQHISLRALARLTERLSLAREHRPDTASIATGALVRAIAAKRFGREKESREHATVAVERFSALGWPMYEAQSLEYAGEPAAAAECYARCGSVVDVRRLALGPAAPRQRTRKDRAFKALTRREQEIAEFAASGLTNRTIAERLRISTKTVEIHLSAAYAKLGFRSRTELAAHLSEIRE